MPKELSQTEFDELDLHYKRLNEVNSLYSKVRGRELLDPESRNADDLFNELAYTSYKNDARNVPIDFEAEQRCREAIMQHTRLVQSGNMLGDIYEKIQQVSKKKEQVRLTAEGYALGMWKVVTEIVDDREIFKDAVKLGVTHAIGDVLDLLQSQNVNDPLLLIYSRSLIERVSKPMPQEGARTCFQLPTRIQDMTVNYSYTNNDLVPNISLVVSPIPRIST